MHNIIASQIAEILNPVLGEHFPDVEFADLVDDAVANFVEGLGALRAAALTV